VAGRHVSCRHWQPQAAEGAQFRGNRVSGCGAVVG
jgi:hypothetical protein